MDLGKQQMSEEMVFWPQPDQIFSLIPSAHASRQYVMNLYVFVFDRRIG
jgi:hypothetical protein